MAGKRSRALVPAVDKATRQLNSVLAARTQTRTPKEHHADRKARRQRILTVTAWIALVADVAIVVAQLYFRDTAWYSVWATVIAAPIFAIVPLLQRFGELIAPLTFLSTVYVAVFANLWAAEASVRVESSYLAAACLSVLLLGVEHMRLAIALTAGAVGIRIFLEFRLLHDAGLDLISSRSLSFVVTTIAGSALITGAMWYALREGERAEVIMEAEYNRSETLLANILPASIADRLKDPARNIIADKYDNASVLFADIAGFTERAGETPPAELIRFLDRIYTAFDALVDHYMLEKIKISGDSYMVVSGVPRPRPDHLEALACFALDIANTAAQLTDPLGNTLPLRIGMAAGPVVAGVVGSRRFFYDVWGDAVNVASRMETTGAIGRIQVPETVYQCLNNNFELEERGIVNVKGKGLMHTWYLVGRKPHTSSR
ncbi:MAG: adenylate/guanylate cyclase domain-containing protein [Mycobacteriaceae bacterium]|nr:adenylate/guanylate cyclase domain-containing protein [Mycobacteriaceae bacterium]